MRQIINYMTSITGKILCILGFHDLIIIPESIHELRTYPSRVFGVAKCSRCNFIQAAVAIYPDLKKHYSY